MKSRSYLHTFIWVFFFLVSCTSFPQKIANLVDLGDYRKARVLLEEEGAGENVREDVKPEALEARRVFTSKIEDIYVQEASKLASEGAIKSALAKLDEGLTISPWSEGLANKKKELSLRHDRVITMATKWRGITPSSKMPLSTARLLLSDLQQIAPDYMDSPPLVSLFDIAVSSVMGEWEKCIEEQDNPITINNSKQFWDDINKAGLDALNKDDCVSTMASFSSANVAQNKFTISDNRELLLRGTSCLCSTTLPGNASVFLRMQSVSQDWLKRWYREIFPEVVSRENPSFDTIEDCELILEKIPLSLSANLKCQVGLLHIHAANERAGTSVSAIISLLHAERAKQLCKDISLEQIKKLQKKAIASISMGERLGTPIAIDCDPSINPQLYDLVRTAFMVSIQNRTMSYFCWHFLPPGRAGIPNEIRIESLDFQIPSYDKLETVVSTYYSHNESVPNPQKAYLESMLNSAKVNLDIAKNNYNNAVTSHNYYPTQYSLMNVNNAYNNYVMKLNIYNDYVNQYNACPSTIERAVYMPYSFKEGTIYYGLEVHIQYNIEGQQGVATGKSMESCFVRFGTRYNDKNPSYRRDVDLNFSITLERTIDHLFNAVNMVCDQMKSTIANAVPLKYTTGFTDREINTAKWLLHPWGAEIDTGREIGVPEWILGSVSSLNLPEIDYKPPEVYVPKLRDQPKVPLDTTSAAKWYNGLIGEIIAERNEGNQTISTGAVVSPDGLILTCAHGLSGEDLKVKFNNGLLAGTYAAEVVFINEKLDVALIRAKDCKTKRWIEIRLDGNPKKGELIVAIGNPSLPDGSLNIEAISKGIVSNPESEFHGIPRMIADITVASGSSGGPLISLTDGKIIGVVIAVAGIELAKGPGQRSSSGAFCIAVASNRLKEWLGLRVSKNDK